MKNIGVIAYAPHADGYGDGELWIPDQGRPVGTALTIHGGGWSCLDRSSMNGVVEFLTENGFAVYNINYRLSGAAPFPACADDCLDAARFLLESDHPDLRNLPRQALLVAGASAGGHLALMTALRLPPEKVCGIVAVSAIGDPVPDCELAPRRYVGLFGGSMVTPEKLESANPLRLLNRKSPPIFWSHYLYDDTVPILSAEHFIAAAREIGVRTHTYFYDCGRSHQHHAIWIPGSSPHRLYPDIETEIIRFIKTL